MSKRPILGASNGVKAHPPVENAPTKVNSPPQPKEHATGLPDWDLEPPMRLIRRGE